MIQDRLFFLITLYKSMCVGQKTVIILSKYNMFTVFKTIILQRILEQFPSQAV